MKKRAPDKYDWLANPDKTMYERFEENMGLAHDALNRYFPALCADEDLRQEAYMGLWKAIQLYDPTLRVRFSTFAEQVIRNHCIDYLRAVSRRSRVTEELPDDLYDDEQYLLFDEAEFDIDRVAWDIDLCSDVPESARGEVALVAKDRYLGKPSDVTCAEQGWKYRRYHERLMQLKRGMKRRKYTNL